MQQTDLRMCLKWNKEKIRSVFRKTLAVTAAGVFLLCLLSGIYWFRIMPYVRQVPEDAFQDRTPARIFYDRAGIIVHHQYGADSRCCFPVTLEELPQHLIDVTIAAEDRRFREHSGVDLYAAMRALKQLVTNGRIVSGASTITMQLVSMREERAVKSRSFRDKIAQMHEARNFETTHSKDEILERYFNVLPYGGNIYGIEAAARYYFGRHASELNLAESILLCGLPQAPSRLRPDRYPHRARKRFERIVAMLLDQEYFTHEEAENILKMELRYRDFKEPFLPRAEDTHFYEMALAQQTADGKTSCDVRTTQDLRLTQVALDLLKNALPEDGSVKDAAMVVLENRTGKVRVLIGTLDFSAEKTGQVNAVTALRSPGSLLKPFFYGEALAGGMILPETILEDAPVDYAGYNPGNFNKEFAGSVRADDALAQSLNTPVIRLLRDLGVERMVKKLQYLKVIPEEKEIVSRVGMSLVLGGKESDLLSLTRAYAALVNNSLPEKIKLLEDESSETASVPVWDDPAVCAMLLKMMRRIGLPAASHLPVSWKTGTSNGLRDAWCIAVMPEHTVGVWFGNKNGKHSPHLVGVEIAAPAAGKMMSFLSSPGEVWQEDPELLKDGDLCLKSGLAAGADCKDVSIGKMLKSVPLRVCSLCRKAEAGPADLQPVRMTSPRAGTYLTERGKKIRFTIHGNQKKYHVTLNGKYAGHLDDGSFLEFSAGHHTLSFWGGEGTQGTEIKLIIRDEE